MMIIANYLGFIITILICDGDLDFGTDGRKADETSEGRQARAWGWGWPAPTLHNWCLLQMNHCTFPVSLPGCGG